jgi:predicted unusual protein kinase regulating ubiquinone biosynthesis (AarF/ABC1/UbiB family)
LEEIGVDAMGLVFVAEQQPVGRKVAVKLIKPGLDRQVTIPKKKSPA